jgi:hypothetical protein
MHDKDEYGIAMDSADGTSKSPDKVFNFFYGKGTANRRKR